MMVSDSDTDDTTLTSSVADSCSTISSQGDEYFFSIDEDTTSDISQARVCVRSLVSIDGKIIASTPVTLSCAIQQGSSGTPRVEVALRLNRNLFRACWESTPLQVMGSHFSSILSATAAHISTSHAEVRCHFVQVRHPRIRRGPSLTCSSMDVIPTEGNTFLNKVPLHPHHRYHCSLEEGHFRGGADALYSIEVGTSSHASFQISIPPPNLPAKDTSRKRCAVVSTKHAQTQKSWADIGAKKEMWPKSKRIIYTSGIRLSSSELSKIQSAGFQVNPDFSKASEANILVASKGLKRSVKLLTILPHIKSIVTHKWLKDVLKNLSSVPPENEYLYSEVRKKGSIEYENEFSLASLLEVPVNQRVCLFKGLLFWVHPQASPQDPPLNDLKSVIEHSGGALTNNIAGADILILPSQKDADMGSLHLSPSEKRTFVERCSPASPDQLFKSVLQQNVNCLRAHSIPVNLFHD